MKLLSFFNNNFFYLDKESDIFIKIIRWMMILLVFIIPFFFLSVNSYPLEFNKTFLLQIFVLIATCLFLWRVIIFKKIKFQKTYLDKYIFVFLLFYLFSFIFSKNHYVGLVGMSGLYSASIISIIGYVLFFYLIINIFRDWHNIKKIIYSFWLSGSIIVIFNLFQLNETFILPWEFTKNINFNLIANSSLTLAIFTLIILII